MCWGNMTNFKLGMLIGFGFLILLIIFAWVLWKESKKMKGMTDKERKNYLKGK